MKLIKEEKSNIGEQNSNNLQAFDIFSHIVTEEFLRMIVLQTSKYSAYFIVSLKVARRSRINSWTPTNNAENKFFFFGTIMCMSLVKTPEEHLH